jgi:hypothetical protein
MALIRAEAEKLSLPLMLKGVIEELITIDEVTFNTIPFKNIGSSLIYEYQREAASNPLGSQAAEYIAPEGNATGESAAMFDQIQVKPGILISAVDIPRLYRSDPQQTSIQIIKKAKQVGRLFAQQLAVGTGTLPQMNSLHSLTLPLISARGVQAGSSGAALTLGMLDTLCDMVPNGANAIIMRSPVVRAYKALLRLAGGVDAAMLQLPNYSRPVLTYNGIPILKNDWLSNIESNVGVPTGGQVFSSVYAVRFNEEDGVCAIMSGANVIDVTGPVPVVNSDRDNYSVVMRTNLAMHSTQSVARLYAINNV